MSKGLTVFYQFGSFRLDAANLLLFDKSEVLPLTSKSIEILLLLLENDGNVVDKGELMSRVWPDSFVEEANLAHHVYLLRKALGDGAKGTRFIQTIPKRGYRFVAEVKRTVNGGQKEANEVLRADASGSPQSPLHPLPKPLDGDSGHPAETSTGAAELGGMLSVSESPTSVAQTAQLAGDPTRAEKESWARPRIKPPARRWTLLASIATAMGLVVGIVWFKSTQEKASLEQPSQVRTSPFTTLPGMENQPTFSPDGNQVAFCWNGDNQDNVDIYVKLIGTESLLRLTTDPAQDTSPAWSPDGRFIAFRRNTREASGFYFVPAIGGPERKIAAAFPARAHYRGRAVDWTPDGKFLVVVDRESEQTGFSISVLSVETGRKRLLVAPVPASMGVMGVAVSPHGNTVAFSQVSPKRGDVGSVQSDVYTVSLMGGEPKRLTFDNTLILGLTWLPDGHEIVFASQHKQPAGLVVPFGLWKISASGGEPVPMAIPPQFGHYPGNPAISRTGSRLICEQRELGDLDIWRAPGPHPAHNGLSPARLIASTWPDSHPQFSPDGTRVAYSGGSSGNLEIRVCNNEGHDCTQLTSMNPKQAHNPRWSPDGSQIAFVAQGDIYVVRSDGGNPRLLTRETSEDTLPSWSRDGQSIYFASDRSGSWEVWKAPAGEGRAVQVTRSGGLEAFESFDGQFLYFTKPIGLTWVFGLSSIWRMPTKGGDEVRVIDRTSVGYWGLLNDGLCYLDASGDLPFSIQYLNFTTGQTRKIGSIDKEPIWNYSSFSVSSDGQWILYTKRPSEERDLMLVENFN
jgi:Tol biopolymer transport system component/DNA-binding winged helix-turn-helix (wHTH) protein